jgi:hypothetical protein
MDFLCANRNSWLLCSFVQSARSMFNGLNGHQRVQMERDSMELKLAEVKTPAKAEEAAAGQARDAAVKEDGAAGNAPVPAPSADAEGAAAKLQHVPVGPEQPEAINALDVHEATGLMAYTHVGCAEFSITVGPLPGHVTAAH